MQCHCCGWDIDCAIEMGCIRCFKRCAIPKTANGRPMLNAHTLVNCAKNNCPTMFKHALKEYVEGRVPPETWDIPGRQYEVATHVIQHRNPTWYPYIVDFVSRSQGTRRTGTNNARTQRMRLPASRSTRRANDYFESFDCC